MREGENILCPSCGVQSVAKSRLIMSDDWSSKRKVLVCAFCGAELADNSGQQTNPEVRQPQASSKLAALLGDDVERAADIKINVEQGDEKLCRNCRHLAVHPFKNVCLLSQKEVDTMDDCSNFELKGEK